MRKHPPNPLDWYGSIPLQIWTRPTTIMRPRAISFPTVKTSWILVAMRTLEQFTQVRSTAREVESSKQQRQRQLKLQEVLMGLSPVIMTKPLTLLDTSDTCQPLAMSTNHDPRPLTVLWTHRRDNTQGARQLFLAVQVVSLFRSGSFRTSTRTSGSHTRVRVYILQTALLPCLPSLPTSSYTFCTPTGPPHHFPSPRLRLLLHFLIMLFLLLLLFPPLFLILLPILQLQLASSTSSSPFSGTKTLLLHLLILNLPLILLLLLLLPLLCLLVHCLLILLPLLSPPPPPSLCSERMLYIIYYSHKKVGFSLV